jgi:nucleoside 2-deoxyribosyltransferase
MGVLGCCVQSRAAGEGGIMFAFVLMPFDARFDDVYTLGIKETTQLLGITAERVDEQIFHKENILERIYNQINSADFIISDMTGRNPNVFYETGYAHAKGKTCLLLTSNADDIPFDLKHHRHIVYGNSIQNLRNALERDLVAIKAEVANRLSVVVVELSRTGSILLKSSFAAQADIDLFFDFNNRSNSPSPELEAVYLYTGRGWTVSQEQQECPSTKSDLAEFQYRHFLKPPVRILHAGSWAQIKLNLKKYIDFARDGKKLQDKYRVVGRTLVRLSTSEGVFDYPIHLDVTVDEIPF